MRACASLFKERLCSAETKDADDLLALLRASSEGTYGDETWGDEFALAATDFDHELAGAYRLGRGGIASFSSERTQQVRRVALQTRVALRLGLAWHLPQPRGRMAGWTASGGA